MNLHMTNQTKNKIYENNTRDEIQIIKEKLLDLLYWISAIVMWFMLAGSLFRTIDFGIKPANYIQISLVLLLLISFIFRRKLSYLTKSVILLSIFYIVALSSLLSLGLLSQALFFFLLFSALSGILINEKWGYIDFILSVLTIFTIAFLHLKKVIILYQPIESYSLSISSWIMALLIFSCVTWVIILFWQRIINFLITKIESTSVQGETLNKVNKLLSNEIESRKTADHLLKEQYYETKTLNKEYQLINKQLQEANLKLEQSNIIINEANQKAQAADKLKSSFLSNMSHEIRTPINAILGFATLIANEEISSEDSHNYLGIIQSSTNNLLSTISDIINLAKIESGQFTIYPQTLDLNLFLDDQFEHYTREILVQKGDKVKLISENNIPYNCKIIADIDCLKEIGSKLIENAIKFTEDGYIKISVSLPENGFLNMQIEDSGIGIPSEIKTEIFENFRQLDSGNTKRYGGVGIGLSIAKGLINLLNGTIEFVSIPKKGATFNVAIPVIQKSQNIEIPPDQKELYCKNKTILIIGKYAWDNRDINQILQEINTVLIYVETGFQAIKTCREHPEIDLVIMSIYLPNMNGFEVAKILKNNAPKLPILAYVPEEKSDLEQIENNNSWDGFIKLPIIKAELIETICNLF